MDKIDKIISKYCINEKLVSTGKSYKNDWKEPWGGYIQLVHDQLENKIGNIMTKKWQDIILSKHDDIEKMKKDRKNSETTAEWLSKFF